MSIASELMKRAGHRVRPRAAPSSRSFFDGDRVRLILTPPTSRRLGNMIQLARELVRVGVSVRAAKKVVDDLLDGKVAFVEAPAVGDYANLIETIKSQNVVAQRLQRRNIDVKALRTRLGISQEAFAGRYGLDVATVRNWEQGRTAPRGPAATLLQLIDRDPDKVVELLTSR